MFRRPSLADKAAPTADFGTAKSREQVQGTLENFKFYTRNCHNIHPLQGASPRDFQDWHEPLDLVFLDGVHHNPIFWADLNFWFWKLKPGGICCGDDFARTHPDVVWGVHDFAKTHGLTFFMQGRIWVIPRPPHHDIIDRLFGGNGQRTRHRSRSPRFTIPAGPQAACSRLGFPFSRSRQRT